MYRSLGSDESKTILCKFSKLKKAFNDPLTEVHIAFYTSVLPLFTHYNLFLQRFVYFYSIKIVLLPESRKKLIFYSIMHCFLTPRSDPQAHNVSPLTKALCRKIAQRFLRTEVLQSLTVDEVMKEENLLSLSEMHIGLLTSTTLNKLTNDGTITQNQRRRMLTAAQAFYKESLIYVLEKMDANNEFWMHAVWINYLKRSKAKWEDVNYFIMKYQRLLAFSPSEYDRLHEEFIDFKSIGNDEIDLEKAVHTVYDDGSKEYRMDTIWYILQALKSPIGNHYRFRLLFKVAKIVLITPHSNAGILL